VESFEKSAWPSGIGGTEVGGPCLCEKVRNMFGDRFTKWVSPEGHKRTLLELDQLVEEKYWELKEIEGR